MKKFFKALALVLALTLIVGVVPAQSADAAVKKSKTIYVGGAQGKSADEKTVSKISNKVAIYKLAGYTKDTKEGHKFDAELSGKDDGSIKITKNYVVAKALGTATVDIYVDGEKKGTTTIYSKVNASKDSLVLVDGEGKEIKDGQEFVIGGTYTFKLPRAGKDSDERRLFINGDAVKETDKARVYEHKFLKSEKGDVTIKFESYQGDKAGKLDGATQSKEIKGTVVPPTPVSVKQTTSNAFTITFNQDIEAGDYYKDLKDWEVTDGIANDIYYKVPNSDVRIPFSSVKATSREKTDLTVTMFGNFVPGTEYFVAIAGETKSFVAAGNGGKDVAELVIVTKTATVGQNVDIEYKLLNSIGVDITDTALADGTVSFEGTPSSASDFLDVAGTVYFAAKDDYVKVKGTFTFYDPDNNFEPKTTTGEGTIVGVPEAEANFVSATYWVKDKKTTTLKMNEDNVDIGVKAVFNIGGKNKEIGLGDEIYGDTLQVAVADEHYAVMTAAKKISAVNQGTTSLILYCNTETGARRVIGVIPGFKVEPKREAKVISAKVENINTGSIYLNTNEDVAALDKLALTITVKDQYGDTFGTNTAATVELRTGVKNDFEAKNELTGYVANATADQFIAASNLWTAAASGSAVTAENTLSYVVKVGNLTTNVQFKIKSEALNSGTNLVVASDAATMDTALTTSTTSTTCDTVKMHVNKMKGNYWTGYQNLKLTSVNFNTKNKLAEYNLATNGAVALITRNGSKIAVDNTGVVKAAPDNAVINLDAANTSTLASHIAVATNVLSFDTFDTTNNKLAAGNYEVSFYNVTTTGTTLIGKRTLTVTDNQAKPTFKQDAQSTGYAIANTDDAVKTAVKECYTFYWDGTKLDDSCVTGVSYKVGADGRAYIYSATITIADNSLAADGTTVLKLKEHDGATAGTYKFVVTIGELLN